MSESTTCAALEAMERVDWSATSLGPRSGWGQALVAAVDLVAHTRFPAALFWGPDYVMLYNGAYADLIADKHPAALDSTAPGVFPEVWDVVGPMFDAVRETGTSVYVEDLSMLLLRRGFLEECHFTFSYSPVRGADGSVEGVIDIATETTRTAVDRRRLELLARLRDEVGDVRTPTVLRERALPLLRSATEDLASVDILLEDPEPGGTLPATPDLVVVQQPVPGQEGRATTVRVRLAGEDGWGGGTLVVRPGEHVWPDESYLGFLRLVAASLSQALDRMHVRRAEQRGAEVARQMSETLQRSLLTAPPRVPGASLAVRYQTAVQQAQVGGDWYDAFRLPDGSTTVVVGDVSGHDRRAAAAMAQVRNLLRGIAFSLPLPPAQVLSQLDRTMVGLGVGVYATAVLGRLEPTEHGQVVRWSNAGHPPPVLVLAGGEASLLERDADLMLGVVPDASRQDHVVDLPPGATLVLYTDGLVERRGTALQDGLDSLCAFVTAHHRLPLEQLCDAMLAELAAGSDDDVVLLALRADGAPGAAC